MNKSSSRSHAVLQLHVTRRARMLEGTGANSDLSASLRLGERVETTQLTGKLSVVSFFYTSAVLVLLLLLLLLVRAVAVIRGVRVSPIYIYIYIYTYIHIYLYI